MCVKDALTPHPKLHHAGMATVPSLWMRELRLRQEEVEGIRRLAVGPDWQDHLKMAPWSSHAPHPGPAPPGGPPTEPELSSQDSVSLLSRLCTHTLAHKYAFTPTHVHVHTHTAIQPTHTHTTHHTRPQTHAHTPITQVNTLTHTRVCACTPTLAVNTAFSSDFSVRGAREGLGSAALQTHITSRKNGSFGSG